MKFIAVSLLVVMIVSAPAWAEIPATQPTSSPAAVSFDTYNGYFVSNKFEPNVLESFIILKDQAAFDQVFGVAYVMNDKSHRLPSDAFASNMVVAVVKRGKVMWEYTVQGIGVERGVLTLSYTAKAKPSDSAELACPLIVSVPKGEYQAVEFVEGNKVMKKIGTSASQPTTSEAFNVKCKKAADSVTITVEGDKTIFSVASVSGIGGATIDRKGDEWPKEIVLRLYLHGLESMGIICGDLHLMGSVRGGTHEVRLHVTKGGEDGPELTKDSPYWTEIKTLDAMGKPIEGLPGDGGYFEMVIPKALLNEMTFTLGWIDFFRR